MDSMVKILAAHAESQPERLFIADHRGNECTYLEAWCMVKRAACHLRMCEDIRVGDRVMAECGQDVWFLLLDFACELIGAVFVPVDMSASVDRIKSIYDESDAKLIVSQALKGSFAKNVLFEQVFAETTMLDDHTFPKGNSIAEILYTTGTTGKSKGIVITNEANIAVAENIKYGVEMKPHNIEFIPIPISHSHGLRCCYANLLNGGTIVLMDGLMNMKKVFQMLDDYSVTSVDISPSAAQLLIKISKGAFWEYGSRMDYIQIGTAVLPDKLKNQLLKELPGVRLYNFYGSTESGRSCVLDFSKETNRDNCIGKPTINAEIIFTNDERQQVEATKESPGLLASRGRMNMRCYWKNPGLTREIVRDNFVFTNDLGYTDDEGYVYVIGRKDDVINYNGIKIAPEEIEQVAIGYPGIKDAACVSWPDDMAGQVPRLFVSVDEYFGFDYKSYLDFLQDHLDGNKLPKRVDVIENIPRTSNGKIIRGELI